MSCCGHKRLQWQQKTSSPEIPAAILLPVLEKPVPLRYNGISAYLVKGPVTGYLYLFDPNEQSLAVDGRDAPMLLKDPQKFTRVARA